MGLLRHVLRASAAAGLGFAACGSVGCTMSNPFVEAPRERERAREPYRPPAHGFAIPLASAVAGANAPRAAGVPLVPEIQPAAQIAPPPDVPRLPLDVSDPLPLPPVGPPPLSAPAPPAPLPPIQEPVWTPVGGKAERLPPVVSVEPALPATPVRPPVAPPRVIPER